MTGSLTRQRLRVRRLWDRSAEVILTSDFCLRFTLGFQLLPSSVRSDPSQRDRKIADQCCNSCTRARLRCSSPALLPLIAVDDWLPPDPEKSSSAVRCGREAAQLGTAWDIFRGPDRAPRLPGIALPHRRTATRTARELHCPPDSSSRERRAQSRP